MVTCPHQVVAGQTLLQSSPSVPQEPLWAGGGEDLTLCGLGGVRSHLCGLGGGEWGLSWGTPGEGLEEVAQEEL